MAITSSQEPAQQVDLSCPLEKDSAWRRYTRLALKAGFWFFFLKGMAWVAVAASAVYFGSR